MQMLKKLGSTSEWMDCNPFQQIGKEWMLVTAGNEKKVNTMTASWGGLGVMWGSDVAFVVIRQSRFTKEFMDQENKFSLSFPGEKYRQKMSYLGTVSGRDEDKIQKSGLSVSFEQGIPYIEEAHHVFLCQVLSQTLLKPEDFKDVDVEGQWYKDGDLHTLYIAKIVETMGK
jgi:flavin reductase (DIM6/NTAB) family NADH-FMN oxidoreductase RutF